MGNWKWKKNKKKPFEFEGTNVIGEDSYFIRLSDNKETYLHPDPTLKTKENNAFRLKQGTVGAGIWRKENALNLIAESGAPNLEIVRVREIIGADASQN